MYLSLHWHGAEGLYTVKKNQQKKIIIKNTKNMLACAKKKKVITLWKMFASLFEYLQQGMNYL